MFGEATDEAWLSRRPAADADDDDEDGDTFTALLASRSDILLCNEYRYRFIWKNIAQDSDMRTD